MAKQFDGVDVSFKAYDDLSTKQFYLATMTSTADTVDMADAVTEKLLGVIQVGGTTGKAVSVRVAGHSKVILGAVVAAGASLTTDTSGRAVTQTAGSDTTTYLLGVCTKGGNTNEIGECVVAAGGRGA